MEIRTARHEDIPLIAVWTEHTFDWGDYVAERMPAWLDSPASRVLVAEEDGAILATVTGTMVSPTEAWAQGIRVHPDHRRRGLGTTIAESLWDWAREQGASVVRLAIDESNTASQAQVTAMGFRQVCWFHRGERAIGAGAPVPEGNGGRRVAPAERLSVANSAEAEPAFLSWSTGHLARAARGLTPTGWVWRRMTVDHLTAAARGRDLFAGRPGWAITELSEDLLQIHWLEVAEDDAVAMVKALVDLAADAQVKQTKVWSPEVEWLQAAFTLLGFEFNRVGVWSRAL